MFFVISKVEPFCCYIVSLFFVCAQISWVDDDKIGEYLEEMVEEWVMQKLFRYTFGTPPDSTSGDQVTDRVNQIFIAHL